MYCRFNFFYDDCFDIRFDFELINIKIGEIKYKVVIVIK